MILPGSVMFGRVLLYFNVFCDILSCSVVFCEVVLHSAVICCVLPCFARNARSYKPENPSGWHYLLDKPSPEMDSNLNLSV